MASQLVNEVLSWLLKRHLKAARPYSESPSPLLSRHVGGRLSASRADSASFHPSYHQPTLDQAVSHWPSGPWSSESSPHTDLSTLLLPSLQTRPRPRMPSSLASSSPSSSFTSASFNAHPQDGPHPPRRPGSTSALSFSPESARGVVRSRSVGQLPALSSFHFLAILCLVCHLTNGPSAPYLGGTCLTTRRRRSRSASRWEHSSPSAGAQSSRSSPTDLPTAYSVWRGDG